MRTSSRTFGAIILACCLTSLAYGETGIPWQTNLEAAQRLAASSNRLVLIHFSASWCHWCKPLETQVFNKDSVAQAIEPNYVAVKLDLDQHRDLARQYGVTGVPWDVVITPDGQVVKDFNSPQGATAYVAAMTEIAAKYRPQTPSMVASIGGGPQAAAVPVAYGAPPASAPPAAAALPVATAPPAAAALHPAQQAQAPQQQLGRYSDNRYADYYNQRQQPVAAPVSPPLANQAGPSFAPPATSTQTPPAYQPPALAPPGGIPQTSVSPDAYQAGQQGFSSNPPAASGMTPPPYGGAPAPNYQTSPNYPPQSNGSFAPAAMTPPPGPAPGAVQAFALEGYCPVHLMEQGGWQKGDPAFGAVHRGQTYLFGSKQCQERFLANPDRYAPAFDGHDPVLLIDRNQTVPGRRDIGCYLGVEPNRRIVLFADEASYQQFVSNPQRYAAQAFAPQR